MSAFDPKRTFCYLTVALILRSAGLFVEDAGMAQWA